MQLTVIIPTFNAGKHIENQMASIKKQSIQNINIFLIDSSSTDDTVKLAKKYTDNILIIDKDEFDHANTRSRAAKLSTSEIVVFLTQDAILYDEDSLKNLVQTFEKDEKIAAVYGRQIPFKKTNIFGKVNRFFNYKDESYIYSYEDKKRYGIKTAFISNSFAGYKKSFLAEINYFPDNLIFGEDMVAGALLLKKGYKIAYNSKAKVFHSHSLTIFEEFKRYFDTGVLHKNHDWLLKEFGKPESEGKKYVFFELKYLLNNGKIFLLPISVLRNFLKYLGYKVGQNFHLLPKSVCTKFSTNKSWWKKNYRL